MPESSPHADPTPAGQSGQDVLGRVAGEYRLVRKLGEGGFGAVYEAEHPVLRRRAAVKVLHQVAGMDSDAVLRFISEAQAANQIRSRFIVDVFSFGKLDNGRLFYVMDLLDGEPLDRHLRREKQVEVATTLQLLRPIAEALDAAHAAGVVHRDLKPQNVFLTWEQGGETVPKLLDFGMAKLLVESAVQTVSGVPVGTPLYMSPEQARGEKVDGRSDVYALGILCHEMLTGRVPFTGESPLAVLVSHLTIAPPRASEVATNLPPELDEPILQMLHKEASGRPVTALSAVGALIEAAERAGIGVPSGMPRLPRPKDLPERTPNSFSPRAITPAAVGRDTPSRRELGLGATHPVQTRPRSSWSIVAGVVALVTVAVLLGRSALQAPADEARAPAVAASPVTPAAPVAPPPAAPPPAALADPTPPPAPVKDVTSAEPSPENVQVSLRGAPQGARVSIGDRAVGSAAEPISLPFGTSALELTVVAPGYEPQVLRVVPDRDSESEVKLKRRPSARSPKPAPKNIPSDLESPF